MKPDPVPLGSRPIALVLPGGAALGSWQAGCLYGLVQKGLSFHSIFGTSIGALNGCAYFQDTLERMWKVWHDVRGSDFFRLSPRLNPISLFSHRHLRDYIGRYVDEDRARRVKRCWFYVVSTDIASGTTHQAVYSPEEGGPWDGPLLDHLLGSISIPFLLPPVRVERDGFLQHRLLLDGNTKSYVNLHPAIQRGAKDILFLNVVHPAELKNPGFGIRSYIGTLLNQLLQGQIDHSLETVRLIAGQDLRAFVAHPSEPLKMRPIKFETLPCREAFDEGVEEAGRLLANPEACRVL